MRLAAESDQRLAGTRILIADDELLIAITIEETLRDAGAETVTAATLQEALEIANHEPLSAALLDVRLGRQTTEAIADVLGERAIPFVFYSGQPLPVSIREKHPAVKVLAKPTRHEVFVEVMASATGR